MRGQICLLLLLVACAVALDIHAKKPEIHHQFRQAEKRPTSAVSSFFTLAVLAPLALLFIGWGAVGANLKNFPTGSDALSALGFHASLGAVLALFVIYWLSLNMMTTLIYMGVLAVPSAFFAHATLNALYEKNVQLSRPKTE